MIEPPPELTIQIHQASVGSAIAAVVVALFLSYSLLYQFLVRRAPIIRDFALLHIALLLFVGGYALYASSTHIATVHFWTRVCYTGVALTPITFHLLVESVTSRARRGMTLTVALISLPVALFIWIDERWIIVRELQSLKDHPTMVKGPGFIVFVALAFVAILGSFARLVHHAVRHPDFRSVGWPLITAFAVWILNSIYDGLVALNLIRTNAQPWIGPLFMVFMIAVFINQLVERRNRDLERRVRELHSLQAVGRALSASLDLDTILRAIYEQIAQLMPVHVFYVALYNPLTDEVRFPLFVEGERQVQWPARRAGNGLTEYVLRSREPLLIRRDFDAALQELGVDFIGWHRAACWLGVPIVAGDQPLGVIAVQSLMAEEIYDTSHQKVLSTIAAQAAIAIQNARLYARTDEALARRVQELDSILRTTRDGVLLVDTEWRILAANPALTDFLGLAPSQWVGQSLDQASPHPSSSSLLGRVGYTLEALEEDCQALAQGQADAKKHILRLAEPPGRYVERTLTRVRNPAEAAAGWLMIFRDVTEERNLAHLRDDLTHMLIHDLRSPLTIIQSCLDLIRQDMQAEDYANLAEPLSLARRGSDKMLHMINQLLDISKLESGQMPIRGESLDVPSLLREAARRIEPLAANAQIELEISHPQDLPALHADSELIGRVLDNLLDNAIKFSPDGGHVQMWARLDPQPPSQALLIGVTDQGPGISSEAQRKLFKKFQQIVTPSRRRQGTGLGLPFCKLAVEAHSGQIWVESREGQGSTFVMRLPLAATRWPVEINRADSDPDLGRDS